MDWIFDLDGTLYSPISVLWEFLEKELRHYFIETLKLPVNWSPDEQNALRLKWKSKQTVVAYAKEFGLDFDEVVRATHFSILDTVPIERRPGIDTIRDLPGKKWILTNSPEAFARATLEKLQLDDVFDGVFGIRSDLLYSKPDRESYARINVGSRVCMIDDWHENLVVPKEQGWKTIWFPEIGVDRPILCPSYVDKEITSLVELTDLL